MKKEELIDILEKLKKEYPEAVCSLDFKTPLEMAIAVLLSAQCTDERVNKVTPMLFKRCKNVQDFADIDLKELEEIIYPCGFYKNKAKNIKLLAEKLLKDFNGEVPNTMEELITLPGIGRKSANVIMLEAFNNPQGVAIDTHAKRICNRLGISKSPDPIKIEQDLLKKLPKECYYDANHLLVFHGRKTCKARNPECNKCVLEKYCKNKITVIE